MYSEEKEKIRDDIVGQVDQPKMSLELWPITSEIETSCFYLTYLWKIRNAVYKQFKAYLFWPALVPKTGGKQ